MISSKEEPNPPLALNTWVVEKFIAAAPQAAAQALQSTATHEALQLLKPLKTEPVVACLRYMQPPQAAALLRRFPSRQAAHLLAHLPVPQAAMVYAAFSVPQQEKLKSLLEPDLLHAFTEASNWPVGSAGHCMKRQFITFKTDEKVADVLQKLKVNSRKKLPACLWVLNKDGQVKGLLRCAELAFLDPQAMLGSIMQPACVLDAARPAQEATAFLQQGAELVAVQDDKQHLLGTISWAELQDIPPAKKKFSWF